MRSGGNNFNYFPQNQRTKLANLVQFKRMLMFCLEEWGGLRSLGPLLSTPLSVVELQQHFAAGAEETRATMAYKKSRTSPPTTYASEHISFIHSYTQRRWSQCQSHANK